MSPSSTAGKINVEFEVSEPAAVFYTLDGSVPTLGSTLYCSAGIREGGETLSVPAGTRIHWFAVDSAGKVEKEYVPDATTATTARPSPCCPANKTSGRGGEI